MYYRLDQGGFGVDNETVPDISGNALDATLVFSGSNQAWGWPSPIETDAASREFWGYTNAGIYGFTGTSRITRASDASMQASPKDCTVGCWLRPMADIPFSGTFGLVSKQNSIGITMTSVLGTRIGGFCYDSNSSLFLVNDQSFLVTDHLEESFYVVIVRSGDALVIYVNGTFRGSTTVTSGLPTRFTGDPFYIHPGGSFYLNFRADEVEYHTRALSPTEILDSYEAALLDLVMRGECNIVTSARITGTSEPDPVAYPFRHNWDSQVVERLSWRSSVYKPTNGATELAPQRTAPRRTVEYSHLLMNEKLRRQYEARAFGGRTTWLQFEPDKVGVGALSAGVTSASFDTTLRDFEATHRAYVWEDDETYELVTLTSVTDTGIEWEEPLERNYTNAWIKPARVARLAPSNDMEQHTDTVGESSVIYAYREGDEPLSPRRLTPYASTLTYRGRDLWDLREWQGHNYVDPPKWEWGAERSELDNGTGQVATKQYRWGAPTLQPWSMMLDGRALIAKYLGWLYERAGQSSPFWMPTFKQDLRPLSRQGTQLLVEGNEYSNLYAASSTRLDLAFVYWDNTYTCRRIEDVAVTDDGDQLYLDASVPTFANLRWLCFLRRVILSSDEVELAWHTSDKMVVTFAVTDAPLDWEAGSPSMSPSPSPSTSLSLSSSPSPSPSVSPSGSASPSGSTSPSSSASPST